MIALLLSVALMAAAPAAAQPAATPKSVKDKGGDLVCKKEAVVGSRMKSRVCLTQAEWDQRAADAKSVVEGVQRSKPLETR